MAGKILDQDSLLGIKTYINDSAWDMAINAQTYVLSLLDKSGNVIKNIDLPLESVVVGGSYDNINKALILTLDNGTTINIPIGDLISSLVSEEQLESALEEKQNTLLSGNNTWTGTNTFDNVKAKTLVVGEFNDPISGAYFQIGNGRSDYLHNVISVEEYGIWVGGSYPAVNRWITWGKIQEVIDNINDNNYVLKASLLASDNDMNDIFAEE